MAVTTAGDYPVQISTIYGQRVVQHITDSTKLFTMSTGVTDPPSSLPPEVKAMLEEKRKRVYALKLLLKAEEDALRVYERMLGE